MRRFIPWIVGVMLVLPVILPFFQPSLFRVHDYTHVARLAELDRTIRDGNIPPRWSKNLGFGYGMPLFSFYAPLPYYLGVSFHLFGISFITSVKLLFVLSFYASFMAMYFLIREYSGKPSAYLAAVLFTYVPYRAVDVYVRGALGELYGILFIVLSLLAIVRLGKRPSVGGAICVALAGSGLILSHNLMMMIGIPFILLFGLFTRKSFPLVIASMIWGIGLSAFFIIPAVMEKQFTSVDQLTQGGGSYSQHFVYLKQFLSSPFNYGGSIEGPHDGMSFELGKVHIFLLGVVLLLLIVKRKSVQHGGVIFFGIIALGGSIFLMSFHSEVVWKWVSLLRYLQFPWRLLVVPMITIPLIVGVASERVHKLGIFAILLLIVLFYSPLYRSELPANPTDPFLSTDETYLRETMSAVIPDYIHPQLSREVLAPVKSIIPPASRFTVTSGSELQVFSDKTASFEVVVVATSSAVFTAHIFDFPGWSMKVNDQPVAHTLSEALPTMELSFPEGGTYQIVGKLTETPIRTATDWISIFSFLLIGLVYASHYKRA